MALKTIKRLAVRGKPPAAPKELTIEEIRERHPFGSLERTVGELKELAAYKDRARELTNAANRQKTQGGKAMKAMIAEDLLAVGDEIQIGDQAFSFDFASSDSINREKLYELVKKGDVKLEDFLKCIYINKDMASKIIGDHILMGITEHTKGKTADIRIRDLEKPVSEPKIVRKPAAPPPKKKLLRDTDQKPAEKIVGGGTLRRRRLVNVGRK